jgi:hypothetical protein
VPSQLPFCPQLSAESVEQSPRGSIPLRTGAQVPSGWPVAFAAHDRHVPVHAVSQQIWSGAQNPLAQAASAAQASPLVRLTRQAPATQVLPFGHALLSAHGFAQPSPPQAYAPQSIRAPDAQSPAPSQIPADANVCVSTQAADAHCRPRGAARQAPAPSHCPSRPHALLAVSSGQSS